MPYSYVQYPGNGTTTSFSVPFPYLLRAHVKLYYQLDISLGTYTQLLIEGPDYSWSNGTQVQLSNPPSSGQVLTIRRETPTAARLVDWSDGSHITADTLDTSDLQNFYIVQEQKDFVDATTELLYASIGDETQAAASIALQALQIATDALPKAGGIMYGEITLKGDPMMPLHATPKSYVDAVKQVAEAAIPFANISQSSLDSSPQTIPSSAVLYAMQIALNAVIAGSPPLQTSLTAAVTLPANQATAVAVSLSNSSFLANATSMRGVLGTVVGTLARNSDGAYTFAPTTAPGASTAIAANSLFVAGAVPDTFNPLNIGGHTVYRNASIAESYASAFVDAQNRIAWGISLDGALFASKAAQMSISGNAATATTATTATTALSTQSLVTTGGDSVQDYPNLDFYYDVEVDATNRIFRAIMPDGTNYMPKVAADLLSATTATVQTLTVSTLNATNFSTSQFTAVHGADGVFAVEAVSSTNQIIRYSNGARTQLTTIGANTAPSLTAETPARILFASTRTGSQSYQVMKTDGSELAFAIPPKTIVMWGDSMTDFLSYSSPPGPPVSGNLASKLGDSRRILYRGVGGQTSVQIASRQGGLTVTGNVTGGQIPASGSVGITGLYPSPVTNQGGDGLYSINGIVGTLAFNSGSPTFTRSTAGSALPVTNPVTIVPVLDDTVNSVVYSLNEYTAVLWFGRNGVGGSQGETDVSVYTAVINRIRNLSKRVIILPVFNGGYSTESDGDPAIPTTGTAAYTSIMTRNAAIAAAFPQYWYDIRRAFIDGAAAWLQTKYPAVFTSDWTQAFPSRTEANLGPDSAWDVANDVPPRAMRNDNVHLNTYGNEFLAELLAARIQSLGW